MSVHDFERLCARLDNPMAIVTAYDGRERSGCLVGFHTQCSIDPPRYIVCLSKTNHTIGIALNAARLVVHILHKDQHDLAELFGGTTADAIGAEEKFARCAWKPDGDGTPIIAGCDWFAGTVRERTDLGDHVAHIIDVTACAIVHEPGPQLGFQAVSGMKPGHPP
jgi:flavin reductase (DIM6/NTAB) family NADH-FMN oxidoreductase RutF